VDPIPIPNLVYRVDDLEPTPSPRSISKRPEVKAKAQVAEAKAIPFKEKERGFE
jgi:hypothetical protein